MGRIMYTNLQYNYKHSKDKIQGYLGALKAHPCTQLQYLF